MYYNYEYDSNIYPYWEQHAWSQPREQERKDYGNVVIRDLTGWTVGCEQERREETYRK